MRSLQTRNRSSPPNRVRSVGSIAIQLLAVGGVTLIAAISGACQSNNAADPCASRIAWAVGDCAWQQTLGK